MPPKKAAAGRGPKASKLCVQIPPKTETPGKDPIVFRNEIGHGGFARVYKAEIKVCFLNQNLPIYFLVYSKTMRCQSWTVGKWLSLRRNEIIPVDFDRESTYSIQIKEK